MAPRLQPLIPCSLLSIPALTDRGWGWDWTGGSSVGTDSSPSAGSRAELPQPAPSRGSDQALGLWAGALDPWDSAVRPGLATPGWQLVPRHRPRPPEQGLWESGLTLLIQTTHRAVSPEVGLSVSGGGGPLSAHLVPGEGWAVLGGGSRTREELGARGGCQRSESRLGLALPVETRICFPPSSAPNAVFSSFVPLTFLQVPCVSHREDKSSDDPTRCECCSFVPCKAAPHLFKEN